jgi:hypothetical protein
VKTEIRQLRVLSAAAMLGALALTACSDTNPPVAGPAGALNFASTTGEETGHAPVWTYVCKDGPPGVYNFTVSVQSTVTWGADAGPTFTLTPGECKVVFVVLGTEAPAGDPLSTVTVTEVGATPDSIKIVFTDGITFLYNTPTAVVQAGWNRGGMIKYFNSDSPPPPPPPPPPPGGQGCTPGYWKQSQHFDSWPAGYVPTGAGATDFDAAFGVNLFNPNISLLTALGLEGGGVKALARHAAAALLNSASDGVDYGLTTAQVIAAVQAAVASGDYESVKNTLDALNNGGCTLN